MSERINSAAGGAKSEGLKTRRAALGTLASRSGAGASSWHRRARGGWARWSRA